MTSFSRHCLFKSSENKHMESFYKVLCLCKVWFNLLKGKRSYGGIPQSDCKNLAQGDMQRHKVKAMITHYEFGALLFVEGITMYLCDS